MTFKQKDKHFSSGFLGEEACVLSCKVLRIKKNYQIITKELMAELLDDCKSHDIYITKTTYTFCITTYSLIMC